MATIYILENTINKKCYVGQTIKSFKKRLCRHIGGKYPIGNAIKKYGIENFKKYVYYGIPEELLDYFEVELIKRLNSLSPSGYNLTTGGNKNKHYSEETKTKISESQKGNQPSEKSKIRSSIVNKGRIPWNKGKKLSESHCKKIGEASKGRLHSEESKIKISAANLGKKRSDEFKAKRSELNKGNKFNLGHKTSEETKKKLSELNSDEKSHWRRSQSKDMIQD